METSDQTGDVQPCWNALFEKQVITHQAAQKPFVPSVWTGNVL